MYATVSYISLDLLYIYTTGMNHLKKKLSINHNSLDWRLFIDSSKLSLKAVLLHNGNTVPSIPVGHSVHTKESYENMKIRLMPLITINSNGKSVVT